MDDQSEDAKMFIGSVAVEVEDMLTRFPNLNTRASADAAPNEFLSLWHSMCRLRRDLMEFELAARSGMQVIPEELAA